SGAVAVGASGVLLERQDGRWTARPEVRDLVAGQDFSAVAALPDGTIVAAAGGTLLVRQPRATDWEAGDVAALGLAADRLAGYRDAAGALHVLALVGGASRGTVLDGTAAGWTPLAAGQGTSVSDVVVDPASGVWMAGARDGSPVVVNETLTKLDSAA